MSDPVDFNTPGGRCTCDMALILASRRERSSLICCARCKTAAAAAAAKVRISESEPEVSERQV